jgi:hypothetical protein
MQKMHGLLLVLDPLPQSLSTAATAGASGPAGWPQSVGDSESVRGRRLP